MTFDTTEHSKLVNKDPREVLGMMQYFILRYSDRVYEAAQSQSLKYTQLANEDKDKLEDQMIEFLGLVYNIMTQRVFGNDTKA